MITQFMLKVNREAIIKVKACLTKALIQLAMRYPEPTLENVLHPNSKVLIGMWDKFFKMEDNQGRESLFKAIRRVSVDEHEHDPYYRDRMQVFFELWLEEVLKGNWKPRSFDHPWECWKNDYRGIGYEFLKDKYYHKEKI